MFDELLKLVILFLVIFDPLPSLLVFSKGTKGLPQKRRRRIAIASVSVAAIVSFAVLLLGPELLVLLNTNLDHFRVAGGIVLVALGMKMAIGLSLVNQKERKDTGDALAAVIGTPLLTGPAAISAIIISTAENGMLVTGTAVSIVLAITLGILYWAGFFTKHIGRTATKVMSTMLGLITLAWGIGFVLTGLGI